MDPNSLVGWAGCEKVFVSRGASSRNDEGNERNAGWFAADGWREESGIYNIL